MAVLAISAVEVDPTFEPNNMPRLERKLITDASRAYAWFFFECRLCIDMINLHREEVITPF